MAVSLLSGRPFAIPRPEFSLGLFFAVAISVGALAHSFAAEPVVQAYPDAKRIVSIGGDTTEILYDLGVGDRIVGRDSTSTFPIEAKAKPDIGYMRALSAEGVLSMQPDLIIAVEGSGPKETMETLKAASVPIVIVPERHTAAGIGEKIRIIAKIVGKEEKGTGLADALDKQFATLAVALGKLPVEDHKRAVFLMSASGDRTLAAGSGTAADSILTLAGAINPMAKVKGYKPASDEALAAAAPETIVMMSNGGGPDPTDKVFDLPALKATPAARQKSLIVMDGLYLLGFGPRTADAVRDLAHSFYPSLDLSGQAAN